jgi:hypothetical protein
MTTLTFYSDPGHGWLEVPWTVLKDLSLNPQDFSRCSYRRRNTFYLEEDCDASKFIAAYKAKHGSAPAFVENNNGAFIRNLDPIW